MRHEPAQSINEVNLRTRKVSSRRTYGNGELLTGIQRNLWWRDRSVVCQRHASQRQDPPANDGPDTHACCAQQAQSPRMFKS